MRQRYLTALLLSLFLCLGISSFDAFAKRDTASVYRGHAVGFGLRPSYVIPTHGFYNGWNPAGKHIRAGGSADINYTFSNPDRGVYQGVGVAVHTFFSHDMLGTPATVYLFQGAPLALLADNLSIGYEWNLGLSAGWKNNSVVTISPLNIYINVAALFTWRVSRYWDVVFGPEYTHFSNGDTRFPNGGANTLNFRIGARRHFHEVGKLKPERIFKSSEGPLHKMTYDLLIYGGWRADRFLSEGRLEIVNKAFPVAGLNFNPLYHFNDYWSAGPSLDLIYDESANAASHGFLSHSAAGISARAELKMPIFAVNIGIGYNLLHEGQDLKGAYGMFSLKAFVTERLFLNVGYRLSTVLYAHNLMFGLGVRL